MVNCNPAINYQITRLLDYPMPTAVLLSGGLDSAVLVADEISRGDVQPIYIGSGLAWEPAERAIVARLLDAPSLRGRTPPLVSLSVDMRDVYKATHWSVTGDAPAYHTPDEDVYLPGRNIILLSKAGVFCAAAGIDRIVIGTLDHNPFPDATAEFRASIARTLSLGLAHDLRIEAPFAASSKADVIRKGIALGVPFEHTLSCMKPQVREVRGVREVLHCGTCSKCRERHDAFVEAGVPDPTVYESVAFTRK